MNLAKLSPWRKPGARGFTLIELMVVVAIIGVLGGIAIPAYLNSVRKSRRSDAVDAMSRIQQAQERWRANNTTYTGTLSNLNLTSPTTNGYYTLTLASATGTGYVATATAVAGTSQAKDTGCTAIVVTVTNGSAVNTPTACWSK